MKEQLQKFGDRFIVSIEPCAFEVVDDTARFSINPFIEIGKMQNDLEYFIVIAFK